MAAIPAAVSALEKPILHGGVQMGYTLGQNGAAWPSPLKDPLRNDNRGGFYLSQARLTGEIPFDSTFSAVFVANFIFMDPQEAYLEKRWNQYTLRAGKFRGAGHKSGSGTDEFERTTINIPRYDRYADIYERTLNLRDFGIQLERDNLNRTIRQRFFVHNANRQNVFNDEPSFPAGPATQALGFDYALDWTVSRFTTVGGQVGALADRGWDEFVGNHEGWNVGYWFKSNAVVDGSFYHQMDFSRLHILNEAVLISNRTMPLPDGSASQLWGASSMIRMDHSAKWSSFFRYEFLDPSDGLVQDDNLHMATLGGICRPSPLQYPNLKLTGEYVRSLEEGGHNRVPNDLLYLQLQAMF